MENRVGEVPRRLVHALKYRGWEAAVFTSVSRSVGQYGSAKETCVVCGPS